MANVGDVVYILYEAENWQLYQLKVRITERKSMKGWGMYYVGHLVGDESYANDWATKYIAGQRTRAVRKNPWPDIPVFDNQEDKRKFDDNNLLEK